MPQLTFQQFTCVRDDEPVFAPLNFSLDSGEVLQVAGPNGAGKTTLLRAVSGLFDGCHGSYLWDGQPAGKMQLERSSDLLYLGHHPGVKGALTASENLRWHFGLRGQAVAGVISALEQVGLSGYEDTLCHHMSAGQQRRVALARMYLTTASVWVLDEPFTAIDRAGVAHLEALMANHVARGGSVLMTSHQPVSHPALKTLALGAPEPGASL